ncbi:MarR family winged helix-turn-helix transcriptional regulator [Flavilitoribacter nigricans]|uniref:MarR family transcriptional regulator n=1 Tax=Flavilitoribacter nigricans (strain ATCC 23147 / DSM 23189 / NBRC 102662 / NCIMB 1420 / SS-2) TaxID=1122177 RepID=A0A2D0NHP0_FLAN2|nr:MarR family transcriptional regulator [Flavilitoribacter nigricans]PHN07896.1 MarR family transcriptional regulator [Flavilitoribacter nigricans DSM 23189 = NBRC 102662]
MANQVDFRFKKPEDSPGFMLWQINMLWQRQMKRALDTIDLTHTQFVLLAAIGWLEKTQEQVTQTEIADHSKTDRMMVSKVLRTLQGKGYISRREHPTDTRAKCIALTGPGTDALQQALRIVHEVDDHFFSPLEADKDRFLAGMQRIMQDKANDQ